MITIFPSSRYTARIVVKKLLIGSLFWVAFCALFAGSARADNPIIPHQGVCDPRIHIFNGKAYLFSTHDDGPGHPAFTMHDWQVFSSPDLVSWKKEFVLRPEDTFMGPISDCWATDGAERHGKYYFYFSEGQSCLGVAVSTNGPGGPYKDALGKPILPQGIAPTPSYDPTVYIDDDPGKTPYIVWGYTCDGHQYHIARLNEDMISLAEKPRPVTLINGWTTDAACITKHKGIYYLNTHGSYYATSDNVYGPYTLRGNFCHDGTVDHGGFFNWHNQSFFAYGNVDGTNIYYRMTKIVYAHYKDNGDIVTDPFIEQSPLGVGQYDARWRKIEAEWFFAASDGVDKRQNATGFEMRNLTDGSWLFFPKVRNLHKNAVLHFTVSSANPAGGRIEVHQDKVNGPLLGSALVPNTGAWTTYQTATCPLTNDAGTKDLYLVFKGSGGELLRLDWFNTDSVPVTANYEAEDGELAGGCSKNTNHGGFSGTGFVDGFGNAGASATITARNVPAGDGDITIRYSAGAGAQPLALSVNGAKIRDVYFPGTTDWETWADLTKTVPLKAGTNTITLRTDRGGPVNIDSIAVPHTP